MGRLVLKIRRGSQIIGTWSLGDDPLEMIIEDSGTGEVLGHFTARGTSGPVDELPIIAPGRLDGDDLTMPLPELTSSIELPLPESSQTTASLSRPRKGPGHSHTRQFIAEAVEQRRGAGLQVYTQSDDLSLPEADVSVAGPPRGLQSCWADELSVHVDPALSAVFKATVSPAEVWLRRSREWHSRGSLPAGSRLEAGGGWIGLDTEGRLHVFPGLELTGTVTRLDGSSYELSSEDDPHVLALGASVLLREGDSGIYVRSMAPELAGLDHPTEES